MSPIQEVLLEMLKWFHDYCHAHDLTYYIVGGSMLGAIRHTGFIPWDDDVDVVMPRPDYEIFIKSFRNNKERYMLESPYTGNKDYYYTYAKIYDTRTTLIERSRRNCKRGVYIDVFPLDGVGVTKKEAYRNFKRVDFWNMLLMTRTCALSKERSLFKNASIIVARMIPSWLMDDHQLVKKVDQLASSCNYENSIYVANLMGAYREKEVMRKSIFGNPKQYQFENIIVDGVEKYEEFLTNIYGNWKCLPPKEKRVTKHEYVELNLEKSWMEK